MSESRRLTAKRLDEIQAELAERWPLIGQWLRVDHGYVDFDELGWFTYVRYGGIQGDELAMAYEQQIAYYEWYLEQRTEELAADRNLRHLVEEWTDSMTYCCRRLAIMALGDDPGEWVPQHVRRPDLDAEGRVIVDEIIAKLDGRHRPVAAGQLVGAGRRDELDTW